MERNTNAPENVSRRRALRVLGVGVIAPSAWAISCTGGDKKSKQPYTKSESSAGAYQREAQEAQKGEGSASGEAAAEGSMPGGSVPTETDAPKTAAAEPTPSDPAQATKSAELSQAAAPDGDCAAGVSLDMQSKQMRKTLQYVSKTKQPGKVCSGCMQWVPAEDGGGCGGCKLFTGPVNANGYCLSYAPAKV